MLSPGTTLQNRYRIVRELGRGGMGAVYVAIDQRLTSQVALKEMLSARDIHAQDAFEREAALLANLSHPNLPRVMDHFSENDGAYLVMQFIEGMDLAEWLDLHGGPFPQAQVLQWADTLLNVLEYLHGHNPAILHRDIKPSNIKRTEDGRIFLLDFGLAKGSLGQMSTYENSRSIRGGTPYYSPLEQFSGGGTDPRSDLYALGATLYHLISGVPPAAAGSRHRAIEDEEQDPLQKLTDFASPSVAAAIERAMSPSRKQRFASATEMRRALRHAAEEDERGSLKDEYRRAEERRRQRDEEREKAAAEAAQQAEHERELREAENRRKDALEHQKAAAPHHQQRERVEEDERRQREAEREEARLHPEEDVKEKQAKLPSTVPSPLPPTKPLEPWGKVDPPRPAIPTIPVPPPPKLAQTRPASVSLQPNQKRKVLLWGLVAIALVSTGLALILIKGQVGQRGLVADPNAQPVQAAGMPTGMGEQHTNTVNPIQTLSPSPTPIDVTGTWIVTIDNDDRNETKVQFRQVGEKLLVKRLVFINIGETEWESQRDGTIKGDQIIFYFTDVHWEVRLTGVIDKETMKGRAKDPEEIPEVTWTAKRISNVGTEPKARDVREKRGPSPTPTIPRPSSNPIPSNSNTRRRPPTSPTP